ncbi:hypothetical protein GmHk_19G054657 [Glycine max]|nr:hypothetical protein GmHk_19G054657 [Glycine max]
MGALSARRDKVLTGRAGCTLGGQIFDLSSSRVSHPLSELDASLSGCIPLSQSASLSESSAAFTFSSLA